MLRLHSVCFCCCVKILRCVSDDTDTKCGTHSLCQRRRDAMLKFDATLTFSLNEAIESIHTCYLLGVDYCVNYLLNNGLYCNKWAHSHLLFCQLLYGLKSSIIGFVPLPVLKSSRNSLHFLNLRCE